MARGTTTQTIARVIDEECDALSAIAIGVYFALVHACERAGVSGKVTVTRDVLPNLVRTDEASAFKALADLVKRGKVRVEESGDVMQITASMWYDRFYKRRMVMRSFHAKKIARRSKKCQKK